MRGKAAQRTFEFPFRLWIAGVAGKEVLVGGLRIAQRRLETSRRHFFDEIKSGLEIRQFASGGIVVQISALSAERPPPLQGEIIDQARTTRRLCEQRSLLGSRMKPVLARLVRSHHANVTRTYCRAKLKTAPYIPDLKDGILRRVG